MRREALGRESVMAAAAPPDHDDLCRGGSVGGVEEHGEPAIKHNPLPAFAGLALRAGAVPEVEVGGLDARRDHLTLGGCDRDVDVGEAVERPAAPDDRGHPSDLRWASTSSVVYQRVVVRAISS